MALPKRRTSRPATVVLAAVLVVIAFIILNPFKSTEADYYVVKPIDLNYTILANCTVDYPLPLDMTFLQAGIIQAVEVKDGDRVEKGQSLIRLDDFNEKRDLAISADDLESAELMLRNAREQVLPNLQEALNEYQVNLEQARLMLDRYTELEAAGGISRADLEKAEKDYQRALSQYNQQRLVLESFSKSGRLADLENQVSISRARFELAGKRLENMRITAPFDGTVLKVHVQPGQKVTTADNAVTVLEDASWQLVMNVDQKELPFLEAGLTALITMDAYPEIRIGGRVSYVCTEVDKEKNTCEVRVEITDDVSFIKYGMTGQAEILAEKLEKVLALPSRLIKKGNGPAFVWLWNGRQAKPANALFKPIGERWVLADGIAEGAVLLDAGPDASPAKMKPGKEIKFDVLR